MLSGESDESSKRETAIVSSKTALPITGLALFFFLCSVNELEKQVPALEFSVSGNLPKRDAQRARLVSEVALHGLRDNPQALRRTCETVSQKLSHNLT